jgi:arsenite-transporting ATPase
MYGYPSDLVIVNRVIPEGVGGYFEPLRQTQQSHLPRVEQDFAPVPLRTVPWFDREMVGVDLLRELGRSLFGEEDPTQIFYRGRPYSVRREGCGYVLALELPFTSRDEVALSRHGDELVLQVGGWRRNLVLPRALIDAPTTGARMENNTLIVQFGTRPSIGGRN